MKRLLVAAIAAAVLITPMTAEAKPPLGRWRGPCATWQYGENLTPANYAEKNGEQKIIRLVRCVFRRYAPGNEDYAVMVMQRESGAWPWAVNSSSGCAGLFQHITWTGRALAFLHRWQFGPNAWLPTAFDPRANAMVAAAMVRGGGWGPWGG
jgi:hypothetical protein